MTGKKNQICVYLIGHLQIGEKSCLNVVVGDTFYGQRKFILLKLAQLFEILFVSNCHCSPSKSDDQQESCVCQCDQ